MSSTGSIVTVSASVMPIAYRILQIQPKNARTDSTEDEIIEMAMILFRYSILSSRIVAVEQEYSGLREPTVAISPAASRVNHLSSADVRGKNIDTQAIRMLVEKTDIIISHNASFDGRFAANLLPFMTNGEKPWYCSMRGIDWEERGCKSRKLDYLLDKYQIQRDRPHRALDDARGVFSLLSKSDDISGDSLLATLLQSLPVYKFETKAREPSQIQVIDISTMFAPVQAQTTNADNKLPVSEPIDQPRKRSWLDRLLGRW